MVVGTDASRSHGRADATGQLAYTDFRQKPGVATGRDQEAAFARSEDRALDPETIAGAA